MIKALIVDDEDLARLNLVRLLRTEPDITVLGEASNGLEALERITALAPDVVFLDIEMPGLNGLDVLANLTAPPLIVFATAQDDYAVRAFEASAVDYLLKPIQADRVSQTIGRVRAALENQRPAYANTIRHLLTTLRGHAGRPLSKLAVRKGKRILLLSPREILHASIEDKLVFVHTQQDRFLSDRSVSELEQLLSDSGFFRISRGDLVNLEHVSELLPWFSGTWRVKMSTGVELDVSRDRARDLKKRLNLD